MNERLEEYISNISAMSKTLSLNISPEMTEEEVIDAIHKNADYTYGLHARNDEILREFIFSKTPEGLTPEEAAELAEFADRLSGTDYAIVYHTYELLRRYADVHGDIPMIIRSDYKMAVALYYIRLLRKDMGIDVLGDKMAKCFDEAASYFDRYEELDAASRDFVVRSVANRRISSEYYDSKGEGPETYHGYLTEQRLTKEAMDIFTDEKIRAMNPEFPWDKLILQFTHTMTSLVANLRKDTRYSPEEFRTVAKVVLEAAEHVYNKEKEANGGDESKIGRITAYRYYCALFHSGKITARDFVSMLGKLYDASDKNDFTSDGIFSNIRLPLYMQYYSTYFTEEDHEKLDGYVEETLGNVGEYLSKMPRNSYINELASNLQELIWYQASTKKTYRRRILEYILACHPPTYIHSIMVGWLAKKIFLRMTDTCPKALIGIFEVEDVEDIIDRREELGAVIQLCGLYHDLGKCLIIGPIGNYTRRLTDEEFDVIKYHPTLGHALLKNLGHYEDHAVAALYHHRSYDGKGGYPANVPPIPDRMRKAVDILTVADSLEAGTDNVGRCYAATKTFDTLVGELKQWSGTRYSPDVVSIFSDEEFCKSLSEELVKKRKKTYYETYVSLSMEK